MELLLSPKQVAKAIGASESSLKRWCDQGLLNTVRTAGGHRRIPVQEAIRFAREQNIEVVEPQILAMSATTDRKARRIESGAERLVNAFVENNEPACQSIVHDFFLAGVPVSRIFDDVIAIAFHRIGEKWECHEVEIYEERSACQITLRILHELRSKQVAPVSDRIAMGATIEGDQYSLGVTMAEIVLRSAGWQSQLLGCSIPIDSMIRAIQEHAPGIFWLSVSCIPDERVFIVDFNRLYEAALRTNTAIVVGGRALTTEIRTQLRYSAFCDTMRHLEEFARTLQQHSNQTPVRQLEKTGSP